MGVLSEGLISALTKQIEELSLLKSKRINKYGKDALYNDLCSQFDAACAERKKLFDKKIEQESKHVSKQNDKVAIEKVRALTELQKKKIQSQTEIKREELKLEQQRLRVEEQIAISNRKANKQKIVNENDRKRQNLLIRLLRQEVGEEIFLKCCDTVSSLFPKK